MKGSNHATVGGLKHLLFFNTWGNDSIGLWVGNRQLACKYMVHMVFSFLKSDLYTIQYIVVHFVYGLRKPFFFCFSQCWWIFDSKFSKLWPPHCRPFFEAKIRNWKIHIFSSWNQSLPRLLSSIGFLENICYNYNTHGKKNRLVFIYIYKYTCFFVL